MLRAVIICPDAELASRLENAVLLSRRVGIVRRMETFPKGPDVGRSVRSLAPEVVFLGVEARGEALEVARAIQESSPGTQLVAVSRTCDSSTLLETMRAGIREFLSPPFEQNTFNEALNRIQDALLQKPMHVEATDAVFAFLPAKAGCGATTIAVNTSLAMSKLPDANVLLADLDLNCGLVGFMMLLESQYSVLDAAENSLEMDENLWPKIVAKAGTLDVLTAGKLNPGVRIDSAQIRHILNYARRSYHAICLDLSGMMEKYSVDVMAEAKRVFLVCTPELPALHLAREKLAFLRNQDLDGRVSILLNRAQKRTQISLAEMEKLFGMPVHMTFPNDYNGVHKALTAGKGVAPESELGLRYRELAETMLSRKTAVEKKRGFLDLMARKKSLETA
jgi:pilus assembly protein CpaE